MAASLQRNLVNRIHNGNITARLQIMFCTFFIALQFYGSAQTPVFINAVATNRAKTHNNIVKNIITKNLSLPLTDSTEENWQDAFYAMEVLQYKQPWVLQKIKTAFDSVEKRSVSFQRALLELVYTNFKNDFVFGTNALMQKTENAKVFAMCAEYLFQSKQKEQYLKKIYSELSLKNINYKVDATTSALISAFSNQIIEAENIAPAQFKKLHLTLISQNYLPGNTIIYSIQRKNRNYPGIVIIRDSLGNFIKNSSGNIFSVPQLARSITNLPYYLTNGNTPQGLYRMFGFDKSKSAAIGPTENIQLTMPFETSVQHFLKDNSIVDSVWTPELYERLLPEVLKKYRPLFGTYYASAIGRTEIIAHGTTVDPAYYKGQTYYPYTPTQGCLCTKEIWSDVNGKRIISDQQKLVDAVKKAGGADGYLIVIEIDDQQKPVTINEILLYIKRGK